MDEDTFAMMIPILAIVLAMIAVWTKHRQKMVELQIKATSEQTAERAAQHVSRVKELEDRVKVLERIVTDRGYDVATQIEALRDARRTEAQLEAPEPKGKI